MARYLIACDSFKECLSSFEVAESVERGILCSDSSAELARIAIADGGEGFVSAIRNAVKDHGSDAWIEYSVPVSDPLGRPISSVYGAFGETAVIETASASGLALLSLSERNPLKASTYGTGQQIRDAMDKGYKRIIVGLGGSATNDAGTGMLEALGFRFLDKDGQTLRPLNGHFSGSDLGRIASIDDSAISPEIAGTTFVVACDVTNPLYGPSGAASVFGPQKGAEMADVGVLDAGLESIAAVFDSYSGMSPGGIQSCPGSGAAGGLGAAFMAVLGAKLERGIDLVLDAAGFDERLAGVDMVITGEGHMDSQTLDGKAPMGVLRRCLGRDIPVLAVCGRLDDEAELLKAGFSAILEISDRSQPLSVQMDPAIASANIAIAVANYLSINQISTIL